VSLVDGPGFTANPAMMSGTPSRTQMASALRVFTTVAPQGPSISITDTARYSASIAPLAAKQAGLGAKPVRPAADHSRPGSRVVTS
jgi:hypothetical protein